VAQPVMHFELIAKDTKKLKEFYTKLFGWRAEDYEGMDYAMLQADPKKGIGGGIGGETTGLPAGLGSVRAGGRCRQVSRAGAETRRHQGAAGAL
jgi:predicted enzyme related to lactoylglutathione lyase